MKKLLFLGFFLLITSLNSQTIESVKIQTKNLYFTPNQDGDNDEITFQLKYNDDLDVKDWKLSIKNEAGVEVKLIEADQRHKKKRSYLYYLFYRQLRLEPPYIVPPKSLSWFGTDKTGKILPDAPYLVNFSMTLEDDRILTSETIRVLLDSNPPIIDLFSTESKLISYTGDGQFRNMNIRSKVFGEIDDQWRGVVLNDQNNEVKKFQWTTKNVPESLKWDGLDDRNNQLENGIYKYRFMGEDLSKNIKSEEIDEIHITKDKVDLDVYTNMNYFSPNGDGIEDTILFKIFMSNSIRVNSYKLLIYQQKSKENPPKIYHTIEGNGSPPSQIEWNGQNKNGKILSYEDYLYKIEIMDNNKSHSSLPRKLTLKKEKLQVNFKTNTEFFTPDGDEEKDLLEFYIDIKNIKIKNWTLQLFDRYVHEGTDKFKLVQEWSGFGMPAQKIIWEGFNYENILIQSLSNLELYITFTNELNQTKSFLLKKFRTGVLVTNQPDGILRISLSEYILKNEKESDILERLREILSRYPLYKIEVQSHSKQLGDNYQNLKKTERRAKDFFRKLLNREISLGDKLTYRGYGEVEPLFLDESPYYQELNDRVDIVLSRP